MSEEPEITDEMLKLIIERSRLAAILMQEYMASIPRPTYFKVCGIEIRENPLLEGNEAYLNDGERIIPLSLIKKK